MADPTTSYYCGQSPKSSNSCPDPTVILWSSDKVEFEVDKEVAYEFQFLKHMVQDRRLEDPPLQLNRIHSKLLGLALHYCEYHVRSRKRREVNRSAAEVFLAAEKDWDREFINNIDRTALFALLEISLEWKIDSLQELTLTTAVKQIYDGAHDGLEAEALASNGMRSPLDSPEKA